MPALIRADGNGLGVFLQRSVDDFRHRAVVTEMDNLHAGGLKESTHNVDGGVMTVKKGRRGNDPDVVLWLN